MTNTDTTRAPLDSISHLFQMRAVDAAAESYDDGSRWHWVWFTGDGWLIPGEVLSYGTGGRATPQGQNQEGPGDRFGPWIAVYRRPSGTTAA